MHAEMKATISKLSFILKPFFVSVFFSLFFLLFLSWSQSPRKTAILSAEISLSNETSVDLRIRPGYSSYETYIQRQLNKTLNPKLRKMWTTRDWERKVRVFSHFFQNLKQRNLLFNDSKALSIGARVGQEVAALKLIGVPDSVGIDLVPRPPLVIKGDFHAQPFENETFDFEFSNVFDHALLPGKFVGEIERTLKPGGVCVLHVALSRRADKYSANDLYSVRPLVELFKKSELIQVKKVDGFGLDTEVVFRKKKI
ncbi:Methyltransferase type [Melia azedarach]|uniref:Methyltransferase type n=1 Tax=Melia azedarach TaxID=155640 RepID=A0ACC1XMM8_MELAZ|nr:Methyltransferase type [Melia azedarach]